MRFIIWVLKAMSVFLLIFLNIQGDVTALGAVRILEAIREAGLVEKVRYYQASSSEMYGKVQEVPQIEPLRSGLGRLMRVLRFMLTG